MGAATTLFVLGRANYTTTLCEELSQKDSCGAGALARQFSVTLDSYRKLPASKNTNAACQLIAISLLAYEP